jgi:hypothetical protein
LDFLTTRDYRQLQRYCCFHTLQFTVAHALGFSVFTGRILATDLSQSHFNFKSRMKSSSHSLIPFLPFLLNHLTLPSPELDPFPDNSTLKRPSLFLYNPLGRDDSENIASLLLRRLVLLIRCLAMGILLMRALVPAGMCLPSRCVAIGLYITL